MTKVTGEGAIGPADRRVLEHGLRVARHIEPGPAVEKRQVMASLNNLRKKCLLGDSFTSAAKAAAESRRVIAAVNRCATQNQAQRRLFPQAVKRCPDTNLGLSAAG